MGGILDERREDERSDIRSLHTLPTPAPLLRAEGDLLAEQEAAVKTTSEYVSQLRRVGKGLGVFEFDRKLAAK